MYDWIKLEDQKPKEEGLYLVTEMDAFMSGTLFVRFSYWDGIMFDEDSDISSVLIANNIIHWMPLPEIYDDAWTDVGERLPEEDGWYIVVEESEDGLEVRPRAYSVPFWLFHDLEADKKVYSWIPFPAPPEISVERRRCQTCEWCKALDDDAGKELHFCLYSESCNYTKNVLLDLGLRLGCTIVRV